MTELPREPWAQDAIGIAPVRRYVIPVSNTPTRRPCGHRLEPVDRSLDVPLYRAIVAVDVEGSTTRANPAKARLRQLMYEILEEALDISGIIEQHRDPLVDRGDGALMLIHPTDRLPKTLLLTALIPALHRLLADHNTQCADNMFRLRAAVHAGEIHYDRRGPFGEAVDITCRLLDTPELKITLASTAASLALIVSDDLYRSIVRHGYDGIDDRSFAPIVRMKIGGHTHRGWIQIPVADAAIHSLHRTTMSGERSPD